MNEMLISPSGISMSSVTGGRRPGAPLGPVKKGVFVPAAGHQLAGGGGGGGPSFPPFLARGRGVGLVRVGLLLALPPAAARARPAAARGGSRRERADRERRD